MEIRREHLLDIIEKALTDARINGEPAERIRKAARTEKYLARGTWEAGFEDGRYCYCPLLAAGVADKYDAACDLTPMQVEHFLRTYDMATLEYSRGCPPPQSYIDRVGPWWNEVLNVCD